jgi:nucleoside-diphosphate-sugar epimerase
MWEFRDKVIPGPGVSPNAPENDFIIEDEDTILVTGANGFVGSRVVATLLSYGFKRIRCLTRPTSKSGFLESFVEQSSLPALEIVKGNLLSRESCSVAAQGVSVVYHLAAGVDKTFPGCFMNSAVTARNLLDAVTKEPKLKRFVNISSIAVYSNTKMQRGELLDESCEVETDLVDRYDPYVYGKSKQDGLVLEYAGTRGLPYVLLRPGVVFGPGKAQLTGRVGINTFGVFLHLGLNNKIPLTYVDNCAEAIVLAGLRKGIEGEVINIVDDDLPKSRELLELYRKEVRNFLAVPVPYPVFHFLCTLWEKYSKWSEEQLPPAFNRKYCETYWKGNVYSNAKAKKLLGWLPTVRMDEGLSRYFAYVKEAKAL